MRELGASSHSRLAEDVRKVRLDRLWAQKKPRRDVPIRQAGRDEPRNLELLRRQLAAGRGITPTRALTGRPELGPRTLRPELGADGFEALQGCPEAFAGVSAALQSAQQLAVAELGSRALPAVPPADRATRAPHGTRLRPRAGRPRSGGTGRSHVGGWSVGPRPLGPPAAPRPPLVCRRARAPRRATAGSDVARSPPWRGARDAL